MHRGYVAIWRKIQDHAFYKEKRVFSKYEAWIDLLMKAQHKKEPDRVILGMTVLTCNYGEVLRSTRSWACQWRWSEAKVRRFLDMLEKLNQIRHKSEGITTRITILNYEQYDPRTTQECTSKRRRNDAVTATDNNDNNVNKDISSSSADDESTPPKEFYPKNFLEFWEMYPRKVGKGAAFKAYQKIKDPKPSLKTIKEALVWQVASEPWKDRQYIPHPSTWINERRWEDEQPVNGSGSTCTETAEQIKARYGIC